MKKICIIAEAGVNHNGSLDMARKLVDKAKESGADIVKFQTWKAENLVSRFAVKADYQVRNTGRDDSQLAMLKELEMSTEDQIILTKYCKDKDIEFLSSPFDMDAVHTIDKIYNCARIKVPSGEITNAPLLLEIARTGKPIILSTGMATLDEIRVSLGVISFGYANSNDKPGLDHFQLAYKKNKGMLTNRVTLLHCTTEYPAPFNSVNLRAMDTMVAEFGLEVGYSDHTAGISVPVAAAALGAVMIEKHFTLDKTLPGPDHKASIEPRELTAMVRSIREIELSLGSKEKKPHESESKNKPIARKSLVAGGAIRAGEEFTTNNINIKRPGDGISPLNYWNILGKKATRDYSSDELIREME